MLVLRAALLLSNLDGTARDRLGIISDRAYILLGTGRVMCLGDVEGIHKTGLESTTYLPALLWTAPLWTQMLGREA